MEAAGGLLLALAAARRPLALKDLAERAGLSPSRAHPQLVSLARLGLVEQRTGSSDGFGRRFGRGVLRLGHIEGIGLVLMLSSSKLFSVR